MRNRMVGSNPAGPESAVSAGEGERGRPGRWLAPGRRLTVATGRSFAHLLRPPHFKADTVWTRRMTLIAIVALVAMVLAMPFDAVAIEAVRADRNAFVRVLAGITDLGESQWYLVPAGLLFILLGMAEWSGRSSLVRARLAFVFGQAGFAFLAVALTGILVNVLKFLVGRGRPRLMEEGDAFQFQPFGFDYLYHSFPSGHATTVGAVALVLIVWLPRLWLPILLVTLVVAFSRVFALAHFPSDVVAGFAFGFLYSLVLARWLAVRRSVFRNVPARLLPDLRHGLAWRRRISA